MKSTARVLSIQPRVRVRAGKEIALGPGKIELLELVRQTGSISEAARRMEMSYMRAWTLIRTMNDSFNKPLVMTVRGGTKGGGGAELTETGLKVLALYQEINLRCADAMQPGWRQLQRLLRA